MLFLKTLALALLISSIGFKKFIYFISIGYGLSISVIGAFLLLSNQNFTSIKIIIGVLYIIYGLRLSLFLLIREIKNESYNIKMKGQIKEKKEIKMIIQIFIWISVSLLYACQASPLTFRIISTKEDGTFPYIGIVIIIFGLLFEVKADKEKSDAKKKNPDRFVDTGLYRIVRCPNYLGELIFWTGNFIGGIKIYEGFLQWFIVLSGYLCIVYVMFSGARRLEVRQNNNYGKDPVYQKYAKTTPILIPLIPLYSVEKYTWLKA
jgi:steroid 5-alpha reductase family enzyme